MRVVAVGTQKYWGDFSSRGGDFLLFSGMLHGHINTVIQLNWTYYEFCEPHQNGIAALWTDPFKLKALEQLEDGET